MKAEQNEPEVLKHRRKELVASINQLINATGLRTGRLAELTRELKETNTRLLKAQG